MPANIQSNKLFPVACIALIGAATTFAFRAVLKGIWGKELHVSGEQSEWIFSRAFCGFTLGLIVGAPLSAATGMETFLTIAFIGSAILLAVFTVIYSEKKQEHFIFQSFSNSIV